MLTLRNDWTFVTSEPALRLPLLSCAVAIILCAPLAASIRFFPRGCAWAFFPPDFDGKSCSLAACPLQEKKSFKLLASDLTVPKKPLGDIELELEWKFVDGASDKATQADNFADEVDEPVKVLDDEQVRGGRMPSQTQRHARQLLNTKSDAKSSTTTCQTFVEHKV